MHGLPLPIIIIPVLLVIVAFVVNIIRHGNGKKTVMFPYQKEVSLFTPAERSFLGAFESAIGNQFRIFGKVRLADVIKVQPGLGGSSWQRAFNQIQSKHLDFVACDPKDLSVQFVVELDDASHRQSHRRNRDEFLEKSLAAAKVPIFRFQAKRTYSVQDIRDAIFTQPSVSTDQKA